MFRHDNWNKRDLNSPVVFDSDESVLGSNKNSMDPKSEALFSTLEDLDGFKDADGKLTFQIQYPRTTSWQTLTWSQETNPATSEAIQGFTLISGEDRLAKCFLDSGCSIKTKCTSSSFDGLGKAPAGSDHLINGANDFYVIGFKDQANPGFSAFEDALELENTGAEPGSASLVELYVLLPVPTSSMFGKTKCMYLEVKIVLMDLLLSGITASSGQDNVPLLQDCALECLSTEPIFSTDTEATPMVSIDLGSGKLVYSIRVYVSSTSEPAGNKTLQHLK